MTENIITPVGRFVSGSLTERQKTDFDGKPIAEEDQRFSFGVAFRKDDPKINELFTYLHGAAMSNPQHAALPAVQAFDLGGYSWKIKDGDAPNAKGSVSENTKGHWVAYLSSSFPIKCCDASNAQIDAADVKRGFFVDLVVNAKSNGITDPKRAGIYLNPEWVRLIAFGPEIQGGIDAATAFASAPPPAQLPPGASATPLPGSAPSQSMMQPAPGATPLPGQPTPAPGTTPLPGQPAPDFVNNVAPGVVPMPGQS
jgi:hypothetical protein